jgi:hypothetical protein
MEPKVFMRNGPTSALIGPFGAWQIGDRVSVPARAPRTTDGGDPGSPAFDGVVRRVQPDGLAWAGPEEAA